MRFVEVAGVSTRLTAFFTHMPLHSLSLGRMPLRPVTGVRVYNSPGLSSRDFILAAWSCVSWKWQA